MRSRRRRQSSSDGSLEELPLKIYKTGRPDSATIDNLYRYSLEACEFCDEVFHNRCEIFIHNAKHIIIPLLKLSLHQCSVCMFLFSCPEDLNLHISKEHPIVTPHCVSDLNIVKQENEYQILDKVKILIGKTSSKGNGGESKLKIKQRIVFEDDLFENESLNNLTIDCEANVDACKPPRLFGTSKIESNRICNSSNNVKISNSECDNGAKFENDIIVPDWTLYNKSVHSDNDDSKFKSNENFTNISNIVNYQSVHYSELIKPGKFKCRMCGRMFPNRFELLKHEPVHLRLRQSRPFVCSVCERYTAGNYRNLHKHHLAKHPDKADEKFTLHKWDKCHLRHHNCFEHTRNHHFLYACGTCGKSFDSVIERSAHAQESSESARVWDSKTVKMCDLCLSFMKNKQNVHYDRLGVVNEVGVRQECYKCGNKFFEVNIVKTRIKQRAECSNKNRKPVTNKDRLKKLQLRLRMLNKMNKF